MAKLWKMDGKAMENLWQNYENGWKNYGNGWKWMNDLDEMGH